MLVGSFPQPLAMVKTSPKGRKSSPPKEQAWLPLGARGGGKVDVYDGLLPYEPDAAVDPPEEVRWRGSWEEAWCTVSSDELAGPVARALARGSFCGFPKSAEVAKADSMEQKVKQRPKAGSVCMPRQT